MQGLNSLLQGSSSAQLAPPELYLQLQLKGVQRTASGSQWGMLTRAVLPEGDDRASWHERLVLEMPSDPGNEHPCLL